jgi:hypothetical protein
MILKDLKVGDTVERMLAGTIPMKLKVSEIVGNMIYCGPWKFSIKNGAEIDEDLGWNEKRSGSFIKI